jgi:hypothetical protein
MLSRAVTATIVARLRAVAAAGARAVAWCQAVAATDARAAARASCSPDRHNTRGLGCLSPGAVASGRGSCLMPPLVARVSRRRKPSSMSNHRSSPLAPQIVAVAVMPQNPNP